MKYVITQEVEITGDHADAIEGLLSDDAPHLDCCVSGHRGNRQYNYSVKTGRVLRVRKAVRK